MPLSRYSSIKVYGSTGIASKRGTNFDTVRHCSTDGAGAFSSLRRVPRPIVAGQDRAGGRKLKAMGVARLIGAVLAGAALLLDPGSASAQRLDGAQVRCVTGLHKAGAKVAAADAKRSAKCFGMAADGASLSACLAAPDHLVDKAVSKTEATEMASCSTVPSFGVGSAGDANAAYLAMMPMLDVFGADLDLAVLQNSINRSGALCQRAVIKGLVRVSKSRLRLVQSCLRSRLGGADILDGVALATCYNDDPRGKMSSAVVKVQKTLTSACASITVSDAAAGNCSSSPLSTLGACVARESSCAICESLGEADGVDPLCDAYDDGVVNGTCSFPAAPNWSVARVWDEALLEAIRRDTPRPTVHARNLFHLSAAMWDAWTAYDGTASAYFASENATAGDVESAREEAISHAAFRLLSHRFAGSIAAYTAQANFDYWMTILGYDAEDTTIVGPSPVAVGNRMAAAAIAYGLADGSNESGAYTDNVTGYTPINAPLVVAQSGTTMVDPNRWQPLALSVTLAQNGTPIASNTQTFLGSHWGDVAPFALSRAMASDVYHDPGPPPLLGGVGDSDLKSQVLDVIRRSSQLDGNDLATTMDVSPGARGNNTLGTNDGTGHPVNPVTGQPYAANVVPRADWARVVAEFWADGPDSETPPGHWNTLANDVSYHPDFERRREGAGPILGPLEWDVKLYLALNGALHDAAIACWDAKEAYDSSRPISLIRYMAAAGQSSDNLGPSYHPLGLPLEAGLVEVITGASAAPGQRHAHLSASIGQVAVLAWGGAPADSENEVGGARWIRGVDWVPYQLPTFVSPAFAGFTSGHSTFSRAAAEVLTAITASPYFPGGVYGIPTILGSLAFEAGPSADLALQWATYADAADDAGQSRLWGGIHIAADDFGGRVVGHEIGLAAYARAGQYWDGSVPP